MMPQVEMAMPMAGESRLGVTMTPHAEATQMGQSPVQMEMATLVMEAAQLHATATL
jgi:hypothetical protein